MSARITTRMVVIAAWQNYADQYAAGTTVATIARQSGIPRATVSDYMKRAGVFVPGRKVGAAVLDVCQRGHDLTDPRNRAAGRYGCAECRRAGQRVGGVR